MAKAKKITATSIAKALNLGDAKNQTISFGSGDDAVEVSVKRRLSMSERASMVNDIANLVFIAGEDDEYSYCPAFKKFGVEYAIVNYFTDIVLPSGTDKIAEFLEDSDIAEKIASVVSSGYIRVIIFEADELIEYRKNELLKKSRIDSILDNVCAIAKNIKDATDGLELPQIMEYIQKYAPDELKGEFTKFLEQVSANKATK